MNLKFFHVKIALIYGYFVLVLFSLASCNKTGETLLTGAQAADNASASGLAANAPNIILILGDDIGFEIPTVNGGQTYQTPNIDEMAARGMRFTQAYASPLCSPSRFMLLTGKYNFRNYTKWGSMNPNEKTLATLLKSAGYATYVAGKWQFDGGNASIHSLGFDDYSIWDAFQNDGFMGSHYRSPSIYEKGGYLNSDITRNKYGDDIFTNRALSFIKQNSAKKFFVYFPITLAHKPFSPTPDDPDFLTWTGGGPNNDTSYFRSMIRYMDKKIGQINDSLKAWNLYNNTIVIFTSDNGTPADVFSKFKNVLVQGGKSQTVALGTRIPMMITWPARIAPSTVNDNLIDFTDMLPTFADAAGVPIPGNYGIIDGFSFYDQLSNVSAPSRSWVFNHYQPLTNDGQNQKLKRWAQTKTYKFYDSSNGFYNIKKDPYENSPLINPTPAEVQIRNSLKAVIDGMH